MKVPTLYLSRPLFLLSDQLPIHSLVPRSHDRRTEPCFHIDAARSRGDLGQPLNRLGRLLDRVYQKTGLSMLDQLRASIRIDLLGAGRGSGVAMIDFGFFALAVLRADRLWKSGFLLNVLLKVRVPLGDPKVLKSPTRV